MTGADSLKIYTLLPHLQMILAISDNLKTFIVDYDYKQISD